MKRFGSTKLKGAAARGVLILLVLSAVLLIAVHPAQAQTETVLYNFTGGSDGGHPTSHLTADGKGNLYGTTNAGGLGYGTVFELSPNGGGGWIETVLHSFTNGADGGEPYFSYVIFDSAGNLYGTASSGGAKGYGVVWELSPVDTGWTETVLYSFANGGDGANPVNGLIADKVGNLYGTNCLSPGTGFFELSSSRGGWTEQTIYAADVDCIEFVPGLTMDTAGSIFSTTPSTVFELSPNGTGGWNQTVIHTFTGAPKDGYQPEGTLVFDESGDLYGTTYQGGARDSGTVYKLTPVTKGKKKGTWTEKILHSFAGAPRDGSYPSAGIVFDASGNIYGTTEAGGKFGDAGTVFELAPAVNGGHKEKLLWNFNGTDGVQPYDSLILDSAGNLYGTASLGGSSANGVAFEVTPTSCGSPTTIGSYTSCGAAFNVNASTGTTVTANYSPTAGNGIEIFATFCSEFSPLCGSFNTSVVASIGDNINPTESCFTMSPHSPYYMSNSSVPDYITGYAWYCPSIPSGVTSFTLSTSGTGSANTTFLTLGVVEWKAGSVASTGYFENVDNSATSNNVPSLSSSVPTSGSTTKTNDIITGLTTLCGGTLDIVPGSGFTGLIVNPSSNPGVLIEAEGVTATGTQAVTATWSGGTIVGNCQLGQTGGLDTWYGFVVPLVGASQSGATIGLPSVSGERDHWVSWSFQHSCP
jgi:uncharacterized repeat protein (TIGR03803 family)